MRKPPSRQTPRTPKEIAGKIAERGAFDRAKVRRASEQAVSSADRLLKEMDEVFKRLERKP